MPHHGPVLRRIPMAAEWSCDDLDVRMLLIERYLRVARTYGRCGEGTGATLRSPGAAPPRDLLAMRPAPLVLRRDGWRSEAPAARQRYGAQQRKRDDLAHGVTHPGKVALMPRRRSCRRWSWAPR